MHLGERRPRWSCGLGLVLSPPSPGLGGPTRLPTHPSRVDTWARLQEELVHWRLTPMQKHFRQPSGLRALRWKEPVIHSLQRRPTTLFCKHRAGSCRMAHGRGCLELPAKSAHIQMGTQGQGEPGKKHMYEESKPCEQ